MISFLALALLLTAASARDPAYKTSPNWLRAAAFTQGLTNEEKANLTTGVGLVSRCTGNTGELPRFGFPSLCFSDGPAGVALGFGTTAFPAEVVAAATWDKALIYQRALAQGLEFRKKGIHVAFSPVTGGPLGRSPYAGRNWFGSYFAFPFV
jgi:beta-glucosidase